MKIYTLSAHDRSEIWTQLNEQQAAVFHTYTMDQVTSRLLTRSFRISSRWRLAGVNIDYGWEMRKQSGDWRGYQYCQCGRKLKFQYELVSVTDPRKRMLLGSVHFIEHAGIPKRIATEIQHEINEIQIYMDEILYQYKQGRRFPETSFGYLFELGIMDEPTHFNQKIRAFRQANLPLFHVDHDRMLSRSMKHPRPIAKEHVAKQSPTPAKRQAALQITSTSELGPLSKVDSISPETRAVRRIKDNFLNYLEPFISETYIINNQGYQKLLNQICQHIMKMMPAANRRQLFTDSFDQKYWFPVYNCLVHIHGYKIVNNSGTLKPGTRIRGFNLLLYRLLRLEIGIWNPLLDGKLPSKAWQLAQLTRASIVLRRATQMMYQGQVISHRTELAQEIREIRELLQERPELHTAEVRTDIHQLYLQVCYRPVNYESFLATIEKLTDEILIQ